MGVLEGRVAIVTAAAGAGIGEAVARRSARGGGQATPVRPRQGSRASLAPSPPKWGGTASASTP